MINEKTLLIVDDEERLRKLLNSFFTKKGYNVLEACNGETALQIFHNRKDIKLIILDVLMPKMNGYEVCTEIRKDSKIPIVMLTAKAEEYDELKGFELGIDEYITKPFSPKILVARVENILKRIENLEELIMEFEGITLNSNSREVFIDSQKIDLSLKEFELLEFFMKNKGIALSREKILNNVWNYDYFGDARTIDTHVKTLRNKLNPKGILIETIWGIGYKFGS